jgi:hypothetical protein
MSTRADLELDPLTAAREPFIAELAQSIAHFHVTGITGDAEVGKTTLVQAALRGDSDRRTIRLDLAGAYSPNRLVWQWARSLARTFMTGASFVHVTTLPPEAWPAATRSQLAQFEERFGREIARLAEQRNPDKGIGSLDLVESLTQATITADPERQVVLVIDHLEAPGLSFRHPVDVADLLWRIRTIAQQAVDLRIVLLARPPAVGLATDQKSAFFGDGQWLRLVRPDATQFAEATGQPLSRVEDVLRYTAGHVEATMAFLGRAQNGDSVRSIALALAAENTLLTDRTLQHARALHRLGGHLVAAIANGRGPYEATPDAGSREVSSAMRQLHAAGIVRRPNGVDDDQWELNDPRVGWGISGVSKPLRP